MKDEKQKKKLNVDASYENLRISFKEITNRQWDVLYQKKKNRQWDVGKRKKTKIHLYQSYVHKIPHLYI